MFQLEKFEILKTNDVQSGISLTFTTGNAITVSFSEIPSTATTKEEKAEWLKNRLNELLTVGTYPAGHPLAGQPIRHYKANVVALTDTPFTVAVSIEAV